MADQLRVMSHLDHINGGTIIACLLVLWFPNSCSMTFRDVGSEHIIYRRPLSRGICVTSNCRLNFR
jgi:hypothetical protein